MNKKNIIEKIYKKKVGVLYGGDSSENIISIKSGKAVLNALLKEGINAVGIPAGKDLLKKILHEKIDIAFIAMHGSPGEDGTVQALLELLEIPYTGSGVLSSALCMNKIYTKKILRFHKLPTPDWEVLKKNDDLQKKKFKYPVVVKPSSEGSTVGVSIVKNNKQFIYACKKAFKYGDEILIEDYIYGREISVGVLGDIVLPVIEILPIMSSFYDYKAKYTTGGSKHIIPADIPEEIEEKIKNITLEAFRVLGCKGFARVDFRLDRGDRPYILEVNTIPGMTEFSLLPESAKYIGIDFGELVLKIIYYSVFQ